MTHRLMGVDAPTVTEVRGISQVYPKIYEVLFTYLQGHSSSGGRDDNESFWTTPEIGHTVVRVDYRGSKNGYRASILQAESGEFARRWGEEFEATVRETVLKPYVSSEDDESE